MTEKNIAYETMKEFVEKYENIIKPNIKKGNVNDLSGIVMENRMKYDIIKKELKGRDSMPLAYYHFAINLLEELVNPKQEITSDTFNYALETIESQVQNLNKYLIN